MLGIQGVDMIIIFKKSILEKITEAIASQTDFQKIDCIWLEEDEWMEFSRYHFINTIGWCPRPSTEIVYKGIKIKKPLGLSKKGFYNL